MKKSRYSETKIVAVLKEDETGVPVSELCRTHGMSSAGLYQWSSKYGGMDAGKRRLEQRGCGHLIW